MSEETTEFYNNFAEQQFESGIHHRHLSIMRWLRKFGIPKKGNILEIGCGVGTQTELILKFLSLDANVTALDISDKSIEYAKKRLAKYSNISLVTGDITKIELHETFDVIVLPDVLEHIPLRQHDDLFKKLSDLLDPNGFILIHIPHPRYLQWLSLHQPEKLQIIDNPIQTDALLSVLYKHGLYLSHLESYSIFVKPADYQVIVVKKAEKQILYELIENPKNDSIIDRVKRKIRYKLRGK